VHLTSACSSEAFQGNLIAHFIPHFVENGRIRLKCATKCSEIEVLGQALTRACPKTRIPGPFSETLSKTLSETLSEDGRIRQSSRQSSRQSFRQRSAAWFSGQALTRTQIAWAGALECGKTQYSITPSLHHSITPSLHHSTTPPLHHSTTPSLQFLA